MGVQAKIREVLVQVNLWNPNEESPLELQKYIRLIQAQNICLAKR